MGYESRFAKFPASFSKQSVFASQSYNEAQGKPLQSCGRRHMSTGCGIPLLTVQVAILPVCHSPSVRVIVFLSARPAMHHGAKSISLIHYASLVQTKGFGDKQGGH